MNFAKFLRTTFFKENLRVTASDNPNKSYVTFIKTIKSKIKSNKKANPWITKEIVKSSERKQKLYEKYLKNRSIQNEKLYKVYENFLKQ